MSAVDHTAQDGIALDSRGILDPGRMRQHVRFTRYEPEGELRGIVQWLWSVHWELPEGETFVQPVLAHPTANLSVGARSTRGIDDDTIETTFVGVVSRIDRRRLRGASWNVAAKLEPGACGALLDRDAALVTDRILPAGSVTTIDGAKLAERLIEQQDDVEQQVATLTAALCSALAAVPASRLRAAREASALGSLIEHDRSVRTVGGLAREAGVGVRAVQRLFREHAGVSPLWMIRRYRLIDAAEAARSGERMSWTTLAADLGYSDQAHLSRDFKTTVGMTPTQYAASVLPLHRKTGAK